jgi:hypothetical protein
MMKGTTITALLILLVASTAAAGHFNLDRTGAFYFSPRGAFTLPSGALADVDYRQPASSWRKEGYTAASEVGYFFSNSTSLGLDLAYTVLPPRWLNALDDPSVDESEVRVYRLGLFIKHHLVPNGSVRPFLKLGAGYFEMRRLDMPRPGSEPLVALDYTLTGEAYFVAGLGFAWEISRFFSAEASVEGIRMNSFSSKWSTADGDVGPLHHNLIYFPIYLGLSFHLGGY